MNQFPTNFQNQSPAQPNSNQNGNIPPVQPQIINRTRLVTPKKTNSFALGFSVFLLIIAVLLVAAAGILLAFPNSTQNLLSTVNQSQSSSSINSSSISNSSQSSSQISRTTADFSFISNNATKTAVQVVDSVLPSVLSIRVRSNGANLNAAEVAGTGYIVSEDGLVVSNKHVIAPACQATIGRRSTSITALASDQQAFELELLTVDPSNDIAILQIKNLNTKLSKLNFADSSALKLGSDVIAIGNVLGQLDNTVTRGIVSGLNRSIASEELIDDCTGRPATADGLIQTDAAINKGNSGGPLFNAQGDIVGMNTYGTTDAQNVGLAIPSNTIVSALNSFNKNQQIIRPRLGITSRPLDSALKLDLPWIPVEYGEIIFNPSGNPITAGSAADNAGLNEGDIILEVDGQRIQTTSDNPSPLKRLIANEEPNTAIELTVLKSTGQSQDTFLYAANPTKVSVILGGASLDLPR